MASGTVKDEAVTFKARLEFNLRPTLSNEGFD